MKEDEKKLMEILQSMTSDWRQENAEMPHLREIVAELCMNEKRAAYILEKWCSKNWYEYGVNVMCGWLTKEGALVHV